MAQSCDAFGRQSCVWKWGEAIVISLDPRVSTCRLQLQVAGAVQGVGFRPFVYQLARDIGLRGWVRNSDRGVELDLEGTRPQLEAFQARLPREKPSHARIQAIAATWTEAVGYAEFAILPSENSALSQSKSALILPDLATCPACMADISDPQNRRYRYPFTNCTHCGPRFSILRSLPYDRANTTLNGFSLCSVCQAEYDDPGDRRFHAQPNACPACGPHLELRSASGLAIASRDEALLQAADILRKGQILALKGLGGFHLLADARNEVAVRTLRDRKRRPHKPFAVMFPSLASLQGYCTTGELAAQTLQSPAAPILLLPRLPLVMDLAAAIAPGSPYLGVMLPHTPLHHLLLKDLGFPVVATSGNRGGEPISIDEGEALIRLAGIADCFLVHNRPIARPVDDSVGQIVEGRIQLLRRARGYAPFPIALPEELEPASSEAVVAVGGHLKNTVALYAAPNLWVSQHLGDLDRVETGDRFQEAIRHLCSLYNITPTVVACDVHPDYYSSQFARNLATEKSPPNPPKAISVQHHYAHVLACLADNQWLPPALGIAWDGTGFGLDGTIWGGEFLWLPLEPLPDLGFVRVAHLRSFLLPGGERAVREPRRAALGLLYECLGEAAFDRLDLLPLKSFEAKELAILKKALQKKINSPRTSSMGRLFDAIASLLGLCQTASFEGQAAMQLEYAIGNSITDATYPYGVQKDGDRPLQLDFAPAIAALLQELKDRTPSNLIAATFHNTMVAGLIEIACQLRNQYPAMERAVLSGGCFQNRYLSERSLRLLEREGFVVGCHRQLPCNDGGLSAGQIVAALRHLASISHRSIAGVH